MITNPEERKNCVIGAVQFYYSGERFVKVDKAIGNMKLATAGFFAIVSKLLAGYYGTTIDGSATFTDYIRPSDVILELSPNTVTTVAYKDAIHIGDRFNRFAPVTKRNILYFYISKHEKLRKYLASKVINYSSRNNILALIDYMSKF